MASIIRESCLIQVGDDEWIINKLGKSILEQVNKSGGCKFGRKKCGKKVEWKGLIENGGDPSFKCTKNHSIAAYEEEYSEIVFEIIEKCEEDEEEEDKEYRIEKDKEIMIKKSNKSKEMAIKECLKLQIECTGEGHDRPDGCAPEGRTWSYYFGEWIDDVKDGLIKKHQEVLKGRGQKRKLEEL